MSFMRGTVADMLSPRSLSIILASMVCVVELSKRWLESIRLPAGFIYRDGSADRTGSVYLGLLCMTGECMGNVVRAMGRYVIVTHVDPCFLQMFICERFSIIASS